MVTWLVEQGADVNAVDYNEETVLHSAAESGQVVAWLDGADVKATD